MFMFVLYSFFLKNQEKNYLFLRFMWQHKALKNHLDGAVFSVRLWLWQNKNNATQSMQHPTNSSPHSLLL